MANQFNPLAPLAGVATAARQGLEQVNVTNKALSDGFTSTLTNLLANVPIIGNGGGGNPGNPNGGQPAGLGLPGLQTLFPAGAVQAISSLEEVAIPQGLPRPTQLLGLTRARRRAEVAAPEVAAPTDERQPAPVPIVARGGVRQRSGY